VAPHRLPALQLCHLQSIILDGGQPAGPLRQPQAQEHGREEEQDGRYCVPSSLIVCPTFGLKKMKKDVSEKLIMNRGLGLSRGFEPFFITYYRTSSQHTPKYHSVTVQKLNYLL
jgi:hypothetical protein